MAKRKPLTPDEKRHRVEVLLPNHLEDYDATPTDQRWLLLEDLWAWTGDVQKVRSWIAHNAKEAETEFAQMWRALQDASSEDLNPNMRNFLQIGLMGLMGNLRALNAIYCASLHEHALRGESLPQGGAKGGKNKATSKAPYYQARKARLRSDIAQLRQPSIGGPISIARALRRDYTHRVRQMEANLFTFTPNRHAEEEELRILRDLMQLSPIRLRHLVAECLHELQVEEPQVHP